jgi:hypothetical protein
LLTEEDDWKSHVGITPTWPALEVNALVAEATAEPPASSKAKVLFIAMMLDALDQLMTATAGCP